MTTTLSAGKPPFTPEMAAAMTEATLQVNVLHTAATLGWMCYHTHDSRRSQPGFPDLVMANPSQQRLLFVELKREKGRQTREQQAWERVLRAAGCGEIYLWRPTQWLDGTITRLLLQRPNEAQPALDQIEAAGKTIHMITEAARRHGIELT